MNIKIISLSNLLNDIVSEIESKSLIKWTKESITEKIKIKFISNLSYFIENSCYPDWKIAKNLEKQVYELRIQIWNWYLLRTIFYMQFDEIILSTWYLLKEESYNDKLSKSKVNNNYRKAIDECFDIFNDYKTKKEKDYIVLNNLFF